MNICFNARAGYHKAWPEIFSRVKNLDSSADACFVTMVDFETDTVRSVVSDAKVCQADTFMRENWDSFTDEKLAYYEKKYDCSPIWKYIYTDRYLIKESYEYAVKTAVGLFMFFEKLFDEEQFDFYYDEVVATLFTYIPYIICRKRGIHFVTQMLARGATAERHYISNEHYQHMYGFDNDYASKDKQYSEETISWSKNLLSDMENKSVVPEYMKRTGKRPTFKMKFAVSPLMYFVRSHSILYKNKYAYIDYRRYVSSIIGAKFYFRYKKSKKYYKKPVPGDKYVLFPLHYQPEASTIVCAQKYEKQLYYIDSLAKSLPAGTKLYLKEHYAVLGHRDLNFYKQLELYPNVRLIDPWADTRQLILSAEAVTTMTGTAGWEAMLLRKPVILGGHIYFENAPGVIHVDEIYQKYTEIMENYKQPSREDVIKYLCEYYSNTYPGCSNVLNENFYHEDNLQKLAQSLLSHMKAVVEKDNK